MLTLGRFVPIETERLRIVPLVTAYPHHIAALNDKEHMRFSEQRHVTHDHATQEVYLRTAGPDCVLLDLLRWNGSPMSVGSMSCYLDHLNHVADVGLMVVPDACKHGYGCEAWTAVIDYWLKKGFKIEAGMMSQNLGMMSICARTDMAFEGIRQRHFRVSKGFVSLALWGKY